MNTGLHARVRTLLKNLLLLCAIFLVFGLYSVVIAEQIAEEELKEAPQIVHETVDGNDLIPKEEEQTTPPPEKKIPTEKIKTNKSLSQFEGLLGHSVLANFKWDPGPVFCWSKIISGSSCN